MSDDKQGIYNWLVANGNESQAKPHDSRSWAEKAVSSIPLVGSAAEGLGLIGGDDSAQQGLQDALHRAQEAQQQYRPFAQDARQASLEQQLSLFGPISDMLVRMYGPGFALNLSPFHTSPLETAQENADYTAAGGDKGRGSYQNPQNYQSYVDKQKSLEGDLFTGGRK